MENLGEEPCSAGAIVGRRALRQGSEDYVAGRPFRVDDFKSEEAQTDYERGRLFAAWMMSLGLPVPRNRIGRRLNPAAVCWFRQSTLQEIP